MNDAHRAGANRLQKRTKWRWHENFLRTKTEYGNKRADNQQARLDSNCREKSPDRNQIEQVDIKTKGSLSTNARTAGELEFQYITAEQKPIWQVEIETWGDNSHVWTSDATDVTEYSALLAGAFSYLSMCDCPSLQ